MALSWNEIKDRAVKFSKEWQGTYNEDADAKPFLVEFFNVFGISRKKIATFEHKIKKLDEHDGYIDLLWKGNLLIEMKSKGKDLNKAYKQAKDYLPGLKDFELPKYILISDFETFRLTDLEEETTIEFKLKDFVKNVQHFGFIAGYQKRTYKEQDPVNIKAAELMGKLHDKLKAVGYTGHPLEIYLVWLLFCLFADDTTIFDKDTFNDFIEQRTSEDGSDLAARLSELFFVLNTPKEKRLKNIDEQLNAFPYVNGKLFEETLPPASFDTGMRAALLECCALNWGKISPAIFGSMFQSVMNPTERRNLGAHYTSEKNILKLIKPLFLDELWQEFETVKGNKNKLPEFHKKISTLKFLDPACGCGNFLVITYRELRLLEMEILRATYKNQLATSIESIIWLDVDMMYGIEYEEFPVRIAEVAMWLIDHQMNMAISEEFGQYFVRLPLKKAATIVHGNALRTDWQSLILEAGKTYNYILGNPPFVGYAWQSKSQKDDMAIIFKGANGTGVLDYVTCWYKKSAEYLQSYNTEIIKIKCAFVSTNSISQGEQVGILWTELFKLNIQIHFAHRTFSLNNEAKNNAGVHVVIIGFSNFEATTKYIFEYENIKHEAHAIKAVNINPYLIDGKNILLFKRNKPICRVQEINRGSDAIDDGNLLLDKEAYQELVLGAPGIKKWIRPFLMAKEFLHNIPRYCLWLKDISPNELRTFPTVLERVEKVREFRVKSKRPQTFKMAKFPTLFGEERQPDSDYLAIPKVTSENRKYIPVGYVTFDVICGDKLFYLPNASLFHFGIISSLIHNTWMRYTCGRLESRYSYSNTIVYNNYPWPENPTNKQIQAIEVAAQKVLDVRTEFSDSTLADLYDILTMPAKLVNAHKDLDEVVDLAYRRQPFTTDAKRMEFLFELYEKYTADLFTKGKSKKGIKKKAKA